MNVSLIYKLYTNEKTGSYSNVEVVECELDEKAASKLARLYNLQLPLEFRKQVNYQVYTASLHN